MPKPRKSEVERLVDTVAFLCSPQGCPWDRKQTHVSLIPYLKEEAKEVEQALLRGRWHEIEDELGDLMLQVLLHSEIAKRKGHFNMQDVAKAQRLKLIRRHPHVFGDAKYPTAEAVHRNWGEIKKVERKQRAADVATRRKKRR